MCILGCGISCTLACRRRPITKGRARHVELSASALCIILNYECAQLRSDASELTALSIRRSLVSAVLASSMFITIRLLLL